MGPVIRRAGMLRRARSAVTEALRERWKTAPWRLRSMLGRSRRDLLYERGPVWSVVGHSSEEVIGLTG